MRRTYLLGFRGAGKTTLGRALAADLGVSFLDLDEAFAAEHGVGTVAWIETHGEAAFRAEEARLLTQLEASAEGPAIVALGGGVVEGELSRAILSQSPARRIYLEVPPKLLWARLASTPERLHVGGLHSLKALQNLLEKRRPHYEKISTNRVENCDIKEGLAALKRVVGPQGR